MADDIVEAEMFIKFNDSTVKRMEDWEGEMQSTTSKRRRKRQQTAARPPGREMGEDYEEEEGIPSVAGLFKLPERKESERKDGRAEELEEKEEKQQPISSPPVASVIVSVPPPPATDEVQRFIEDYVSKHSIHSKFRWRDYHISRLESSAAEWKPQPMRDTVDVLKRKIMAWVRGQTEKEADGADVVDAE
jgi:hypothetical protein